MFTSFVTPLPKQFLQDEYEMLLQWQQAFWLPYVKYSWIFAIEKNLISHEFPERILWFFYVIQEHDWKGLLRLCENGEAFKFVPKEFCKNRKVWGKNLQKGCTLTYWVWRLLRPGSIVVLLPNRRVKVRIILNLHVLPTIIWAEFQEKGSGNGSNTRREFSPTGVMW